MDSRKGAGNQNNGRFDLSGNNPQNVNYPPPPPPPSHQQHDYNYPNNGMDNQRFNMNQPLMSNNNMHPENNQQQQNRFDLSGQPPPPQMQPPSMNYVPQAQNEQPKEYVKPEVNYNYNQGMEKGNYQSEHAVNSGNPDGGAININIALPSMDNQGMYMQPPTQYDFNDQQNNQFQGQNINLPQAENYIPGQQVNPPNNQPNPQLQAEQIKMNPQGQYVPPLYPVGAPIGPNMGNPNLPQGQPIMIQPLSNNQPQQIFAVQRQINVNVLPSNLDHCQYPQQMKCPACQRVGTSQVVCQTGSGTYTCCILAFLCIYFFALPILWIDTFQDKQHYCPFCGYQVGYYKYKPF
ncbi:hypothetical protein ABPG72_002500 [Tetrahymena utriculariae]